MERTKQIVVKVFSPGNRSHKTFRFHAPKGRQYTEKGVDLVRARAAAMVEINFPDQDYSIKGLPCPQFNFIWAGARPAAERGA